MHFSAFRMIFYACNLVLVSDTQHKNSQDRIFEMQRESYVKRLFSLKTDLETLQIQYDTFKSDNTDGRHNTELKNNRKAQVIFYYY